MAVAYLDPHTGQTFPLDQPRRLGVVRGTGPLENITLRRRELSICRCCLYTVLTLVF